MSSIQEFTEEQLATARAKAWHQTGDALVTLEAAKGWINERGLVLFAPRSAQLATPAPSLVEATLGAANVAPTAAETDVARTLVARLVEEGLALPLNLLGVPGDSPDFVVSAQVFSYVFTLRGDKAWKLPPSTSGAVKVSPLGLRVFEVLTERGAMTAMELANELGREVTETAILRSLSELWGQLRVIPLIAAGDGTGHDGSSTLWELTTRRFTKAIKAGANAGQPTALSALVSLYLSQVFGATEEEVATFLSPLTARSRVREVLNALVGARQLETVVVEGKTLVHIPGTMPEFAAGETTEGAENIDAEATIAVVKPKKVGTGRIKSFTSEEKSASEYRGKPVRSLSKPAGGFKKPNFGEKARGFAGKPGGFAAKGKFAGKSEGAGGFEARPDRERRPFKRAEGVEGKPSFDKPWDENKPKRTFAARPAFGAKPAYGAKSGAGKPDSFSKFRKPAPEDRAPLGDREQAGLPAGERVFTKRKFERESTERDERKTLAKHPYTTRASDGEGRGFAAKPRTFGAKPFGAKPFAAKSLGAKPFGAKRPYTPRDAEGGAERPTFKPRSYEARGASGGFAGRAASGAKRPYVSRSASSESAEGGERPYAKRPYTPRTEGEGFAKRSYTPRTSEGGGERSSFAKKPYAPRGGGGFAKRTFTSSADETPGAPVERSIPKRPHKPRAADADQRIFTKAPWTPSEEAAPKRNFKPREGGARPAGRSGPKKFGAKPGGFAKRGPAKPFGRKPGAEE